MVDLVNNSYLFCFALWLPLHVVLLEVTGGKLLICCCAREAAVYWGTQSLPEVRSNLMAIQAKSIPDALSLPSLCAAFVRTGDVLLIPPGYIVLEKCVHDDDIGIRQGIHMIKLYLKKLFSLASSTMLFQGVSANCSLYCIGQFGHPIMLQDLRAACDKHLQLCFALCC